MPPDEPGLEVLSQDRLHHVLGREVTLQQREVAAEDREDAPVGERKFGHVETLRSRGPP